jgi:hypothetical protein
MTQNNNYNGWTNYETWVTALWIDNDQNSYNYRNELAEQARKEHKEQSDRPAPAPSRKLLFGYPVFLCQFHPKFKTLSIDSISNLTKLNLT